MFENLALQALLLPSFGRLLNPFDSGTEPSRYPRVKNHVEKRGQVSGHVPSELKRPCRLRRGRKGGGWVSLLSPGLLGSARQAPPPQV